MAGILSIILIALPWLGALLIWLIGDSRPKILHALSVGISLAAGVAGFSFWFSSVCSVYLH